MLGRRSKVSMILFSQTSLSQGQIKIQLTVLSGAMELAFFPGQFELSVAQSKAQSLETRVQTYLT